MRVFKRDGDNATRIEDYLGGIYINITVSIECVETLPRILTPSSFEHGGFVYLYVLKSTGIVYCNIGDGTITLGQYLYGSNGYDRGLGLYFDKGNGIYCSVESLQTYHAHKNGVWTEFSSGGIVDVDLEFPIENISDKAVYRLAHPNADIFVIYNGIKRTLEDWFESHMKWSITKVVKIVNAVPESIERSDMSNNSTLYLYVVRNTAEVYCNYGDGSRKLARWIFTSDDYDKGLLKDTTEDGVYCGASYTYHAYKNGAWTELAQAGKTVQVVETEEEMDEILNKATKYTVGNYYQYIGETIEGGNYKQGCVYKVKEAN